MYILRSASFHYKLRKYTTDEARLRLPPYVVACWADGGDHYDSLSYSALRLYIIDPAKLYYFTTTLGNIRLRYERTRANRTALSRDFTIFLVFFCKMGAMISYIVYIRIMQTYILMHKSFCSRILSTHSTKENDRVTEKDFLKWQKKRKRNNKVLSSLKRTMSMCKENDRWLSFFKLQKYIFEITKIILFFFSFNFYYVV